MSVLTPSSSAAVLSFQPRFEAWRETWHCQVLADRELSHRDKSVAGRLLWYLKRDERACFPSYTTIAKGVGITPRDAIRSIARLVARGHLLRQRRDRQTNYYVPQVVAPCHGGSGTLPLGGSGKIDTLTSDYRTQERNNLVSNEGRQGRCLARKKGEANKPSDSPSSPSTYCHSQEVPRAAAPGDVPPADDVLIEYDTPEADMAARYMGRALGKPFLRYGRSRGFYLSRAEYDAIKALAAAEGGGQ